MSRPVVVWPPPDATARDVVRDVGVLRAALDGSGPAVAVPGARVGPGMHVPDDVALVAATSGTTGTPKPALLTADALDAAVAGTAVAFGGPGQSVLAVPATHISGLTVILRNLAAGYDTAATAPGHFGPSTLVEVTRRLDPRAGRHYVTIVPTQLRRLLDHPDAVAALCEYDRVIVGAAPLPPALEARALDLGIRAVNGYGCSEVVGGCAYDGTPVPGMQARVDDDGRIHLGGRQVALGYLGGPGGASDAGAFSTEAVTTDAFTTDADGTRWFRTDDHGELDADGRLRVIGRLDDIVNTGGLKVAPTVVEAAFEHVPAVRETMVTGLPDGEWGERVAALVVPAPGCTPTVADLRAALADHLPSYAMPRTVRLVESLPVRGAGKADRVRARELLAEAPTG